MASFTLCNNNNNTDSQLNIGYIIQNSLGKYHKNEKQKISHKVSSVKAFTGGLTSTPSDSVFCGDVPGYATVG